MANFWKWATLPILLAVAVSLWFGVLRDTHDYSRKLTQEDRHAEQVGAKPLPKSPVQFSIKGHRTDCMQLTGAEFDGEALYIDWNLRCVPETHYVAVYWTEKTADGSVVAQSYEYIFDGGHMEVGEHGQFKASEYRFSLDPRAVLIELSVEH